MQTWIMQPSSTYQPPPQVSPTSYMPHHTTTAPLTNPATPLIITTNTTPPAPTQPVILYISTPHQISTGIHTSPAMPTSDPTAANLPSTTAAAPHSTAITTQPTQRTTSTKTTAREADEQRERNKHARSRSQLRRRRRHHLRRRSSTRRRRRTSRQRSTAPEASEHEVVSIQRERNKNPAALQFRLISQGDYRNV